MILATELKDVGYTDTPAKFQQGLIVCLIDMFPGRSIDGLTFVPADALRYCDEIRNRTGVPKFSDAVILKALMNLRRSSECPVGLKSAPRRPNLDVSLESLGYDGTTLAFRELLIDCLADIYKDQTIDEMLCHPHESQQYCHFVRRKSEVSAMSDDFILSSLMNVRKSN